MSVFKPSVVDFSIGRPSSFVMVFPNFSLNCVRTNDGISSEHYDSLKNLLAGSGEAVIVEE